ncbi:MAG: VWA domain-containing protein [Acidobacteriota bacterium]|nr:VWA domain-containing protein [Acidobacteriota bacterium]
MKNLAFSVFLIGLVFVGSVVAQQTPPPRTDDDDIVRITTTLIQVDVSVTDKKGKQVTDLKPEDFEIYENGKKQEITNFSYISVAAPKSQADGAALTEAGKKEKITNLPPVPIKLKPGDVRRTIALVVDDFSIAFGGLAHVKDTLRKFVNEQMQPNDLVAIIRASGGSGVFQQFTSDKRLLLASINKIKPNLWKVTSFLQHSNALGDAQDWKYMNRINAHYTLGALGALNFLIKSMGELPGRKAIVLFSEGFILQEKPKPANSNDRVSSNQNAGMPDQRAETANTVRESLLRNELREVGQIFSEIGNASRVLVESANRAGVVINTVDSRGLLEPMYEAADGTFIAGQVNGFSGAAAAAGGVVAARNELMLNTQTSLIYLAEETGGRAFLNNNGFTDAVQKAVDDQNGYYLLGYQPDDEIFDPKTRRFNKFEVRVKNRQDLTVRYRSGFFGVTDDKLKVERRDPGQEIAEALFSPFDSSEIALNFTPFFSADAKSKASVSALLHVGGENLIFAKEANGARKGNFEVLAYTFDSSGRVVDRVAKIYTLNINENDYQKLLQQGLVYNMNVPIKKPGAYQLKIALRDTANGKIGSASQFIEIPKVEKGELSLSGILLQNFTEAEWKARIQKTAATNPSANRFDNLAIQTDTATRQFKPGTLLSFAYEIYNVKPGAQLESQMRLFREGKLIFEGNREPIPFAERKTEQGLLTLGKELTPGSYVLQILVSDKTKSKKQPAAQWIDFEIVH